MSRPTVKQSLPDGNAFLFPYLQFPYRYDGYTNKFPVKNYVTYNPGSLWTYQTNKPCIGVPTRPAPSGPYTDSACSMYK